MDTIILFIFFGFCLTLVSNTFAQSKISSNISRKSSQLKKIQALDFLANYFTFNKMWTTEVPRYPEVRILKQPKAYFDIRKKCPVIKTGQDRALC